MSEITLTRDPAHIRHGSSIGQPLTRRDGVLKVTGAARYAADNHPHKMLFAVMAVSTIARGRVAAPHFAGVADADGLGHETLAAIEPDTGRQYFVFRRQQCGAFGGRLQRLGDDNRD